MQLIPIRRKALRQLRRTGTAGGRLRQAAETSQGTREVRRRIHVLRFTKAMRAQNRPGNITVARDALESSLKLPPRRFALGFAVQVYLGLKDQERRRPFEAALLLRPKRVGSAIWRGGMHNLCKRRSVIRQQRIRQRTPPLKHSPTNNG